ncbi:MAG: hypothetical protein MUF62_00735 [Chitinophagaceae bacterium]|nr:hypothetical protein [Chitinophagaceae bacterium]
MASLLMSAAFSQPAQLAFLQQSARLPAAAKAMKERPATAAIRLPMRPALPPLRPATLPAAWYVQHMAPTCRAEWKMQKATGVPLRIRLGSLQYSNYLEGK